MVLGVDFCRTQVNQLIRNCQDRTNPVAVKQVPKVGVERIDKVYVSLGDNVNIDTGIISLYGDDTPSKLLFETTTVSE